MTTAVRAASGARAPARPPYHLVVNHDSEGTLFSSDFDDLEVATAEALSWAEAIVDCRPMIHRVTDAGLVPLVHAANLAHIQHLERTIDAAAEDLKRLGASPTAIATLRLGLGQAALQATRHQSTLTNL